MKKGIFFFAAALMMSSCVDQLTVDSPKAEMDGAAVVMVFEAAPEAQVDTRTSLSGDVVSWTVADRISVFAGMENAPFELKEINADGTGVFEGTAVEADSYYALYPYSAAATITEAGVISTSLPCEQKGVAGTFDNGLNIAVAEVSGGKFTMMNVCGLVKFDIVRSDIAAVSLFGNGHEYLAGDVDIAFGEDGKPSYTVTNGTKYVTLTPKEGKTFAPGTYYFTILPQTLKGGMSLVYMTEGQSGTVATASDAVVARSAYLTIKANPESALQLNKVIDLSDPDGDGTSETANCYVAGLAGRRYCFPATVMGNGYTTPADEIFVLGENIQGSAPGITPSPLLPVSGKLMWQTEQSLLKHVIVKDGYLYFTLNGKVGETLTPGNALVAALGIDYVPVWSWHIWVTDADLDSKLQTWKVHATADAYSAYKDPQLMDRNLGALDVRGFEVHSKNIDHGLIYQWGRKDPFVGADDSKWGSTAMRTTYDSDDVEIGNYAPVSAYSSEAKWTYVNKIHMKREDLGKYPMTFYYTGTTKNNQFWLDEICHDLWGRPFYDIAENTLGHKTIYDPCPPGYRVMNPYAVTGATAVLAGGKYTAVGEGSNLVNYSSYSTSKEALQIKYDGTNIAYLPANGITYFEDAAKFPVTRTGSYGYLWTSSLTNSYSSQAYRLHFDTANFNSMGRGYVSYGHGVRCEKIK